MVASSLVEDAGAQCGADEGHTEDERPRPPYAVTGKRNTRRPLDARMAVCGGHMAASGLQGAFEAGHRCWSHRCIVFVKTHHTAHS